MESWQLGLIVKPFLMFALAFCVLYPARMLVKRYVPEGRVKALLLATNEEKKVLFWVIIITFYVCLFWGTNVFMARY